MYIWHLLSRDVFICVIYLRTLSLLFTFNFITISRVHNYQVMGGESTVNINNQYYEFTHIYV